MMTNVYGVCFLITLIVLFSMAIRDYSNIDLYYCSTMIVISVVLMGYWLKAGAISVEDSKVANCFLYMDGTILPVLIIFSMFKSLRINMQKPIKIGFYLLAFAHLGMVYLCKDNNLYYATYEIQKTNLGTLTYTTGGPLKILHYIFLALVMAAVLFTLIVCYSRKADYSKKVLHTYSLLSLVVMLAYVIEIGFDAKISILPIIYTLGDVYMAIDYEYTHSHDIDCVVVDQQRERTNRGYIIFDKWDHLLSYNETILEFIPELKGMQYDEKLSTVPETDGYELSQIFYPLLNKFKREESSESEYVRGDIRYRLTVSNFYMRKGGRSLGYLVEMQDVTAEHGYIELIKDYNKSLKSEIQSQTQHVKLIQQKIVLGMATIIENRDSNTGGHVRRTSDIIKIIVDEMRRQNVGNIDRKFAEDIIRSAPMHDLGKISIDSQILCKPARLTDEEYEIMKSHSSRSGEIVKSILTDVEEDEFVNRAYCLARFHHERWDGKGYPEGLMEEEIPLEARVMAVADVYDALVSKRCYKEPMSFEQAAKIMVEGMGTQFDPMMEPIFLGCKDKLEEYYQATRE